MYHVVGYMINQVTLFFVFASLILFLLLAVKVLFLKCINNDCWKFGLLNRGSKRQVTINSLSLYLCIYKRSNILTVCLFLSFPVPDATGTSNFAVPESATLAFDPSSSSTFAGFKSLYLSMTFSDNMWLTPLAIPCIVWSLLFQLSRARCWILPVHAGHVSSPHKERNKRKIYIWSALLHERTKYIYIQTLPMHVFVHQNSLVAFVALG